MGTYGPDLLRVFVPIFFRVSFAVYILGFHLSCQPQLNQVQALVLIPNIFLWSKNSAKKQDGTAYRSVMYQLARLQSTVQ